MHKHTNIPVYNVNLSFMIPYISVLFKKGCVLTESLSFSWCQIRVWYFWHFWYSFASVLQEVEYAYEKYTSSMINNKKQAADLPF